MPLFGPYTWMALSFFFSSRVCVCHQSLTLCTLSHTHLAMLAQLEIKVERRFVEELAHRCRQERQQMRYDLYFARQQRNQAAYKRIQTE